eukprot:284341-Chlamydomonas_euryale.AAC.1
MDITLPSFHFIGLHLAPIPRPWRPHRSGTRMVGDTQGAEQLLDTAPAVPSPPAPSHLIPVHSPPSPSPLCDRTGRGRAGRRAAAGRRADGGVAGRAQRAGRPAGAWRRRVPAAEWWRAMPRPRVQRGHRRVCGAGLDAGLGRARAFERAAEGVYAVGGGPAAGRRAPRGRDPGVCASRGRDGRRCRADREPVPGGRGGAAVAGAAGARGLAAGTRGGAWAAAGAGGRGAGPRALAAAWWPAVAGVDAAACVKSRGLQGPPACPPAVQPPHRLPACPFARE